jgi:CRP-like cAMP-binding protein
MVVQQTNIWCLEKVHLLSCLAKDELEEFDQITISKSAKKNDIIYFPNEPSRVIFFLKRGRVKIGSYSDEGKEVIKQIIYPGEAFGEMGLFGEEKRRDYAIAMDSEVRMCVLNLEDFKSMMDKYPALNCALIRVIGDKVRRIERRLEELSFKDARQRIISFMVDMAERYGKKIGAEMLVKHDLTHQDIANLTATSRQTVTAVFNSLKEKNLIYTERSRFLIRDLDKLK